jgi:hypothetical protein
MARFASSVRLFARFFPRTLVIAVFFILLQGASSLHAQEGYEHLSPLAHGAGRTYSVSSDGLDAVGLNPAILGLGTPTILQLSIIPITSFGLSAGPSFRDVNALTDIFGQNGGFVNDTTRKTVIDLLRDGKLSGRGDVRVFGLSYSTPATGTFALTWTTHAAIRADLPSSFLDYFFNAETNLAQADLSASNFDIQGLWYNEYGLSYGLQLIKDAKDSSDRGLGSLAIGGAVKYVGGVAYLGLDPDNTVQITGVTNGKQLYAKYALREAYPDAFDPQHVPNRFDFSFLSSATAGSGVGFDLGVIAGFFHNEKGKDAISLAMSLTDIGSINWTKNTYLRHADTTKIIHFIGTSITAVNDSLAALAGKLDSVGSFSTPLPTMLRIGFALDLESLGLGISGTNFRAVAEFATGLTTVVGSLKNARFGVGLIVDHPSSLFGFHAGVGLSQTSQSSDLTLALGTTILKRVSLDVATAAIDKLFSSSSGTIDIAFSLRVLLL